jgi:hypothetical protein
MFGDSVLRYNEGVILSPQVNLQNLGTRERTHA